MAWKEETPSRLLRRMCMQLANLYPQYFQIVVLEESAIKSVCGPQREKPSVRTERAYGRTPDPSRSSRSMVSLIRI